MEFEFGSMLYFLERERERLEERTFDEATVVFNGRTYTTRQRRRGRLASPPPDPETLMRTSLPTPASWLPQTSRPPSSSPQGHAAAATRSNKRARVPASDEAILGLRVVTGSSGECAICLQDFDFHADPDDAPTLRAMPCSHAFHQHCIFEWLRRNAVCPLCRFQLSTEEEDKEEEEESTHRGAGEAAIEENGEDRTRTAILWEHYRRTRRRTPFSS